MRIFIGVGFNDQVKRYLSNAQKIIKTEAKSGNFTSYHNFHLTLRFLGEIEEEKIDLLKKALNITAFKISPFYIKIGRIDTFKKKNKYIIYNKITTNIDKLNDLYHELESALSSVGFKKEDRPYRPHITLGRNVEIKSTNIFQKITGCKTEVFVSEIILYHSHHKNNVLTYTPIHVISLNGTSTL